MRNGVTRLNFKWRSARACDAARLHWQLTDARGSEPPDDSLSAPADKWRRTSPGSLRIWCSPTICRAKLWTPTTGGAYPRELFERRQEPCGHLRKVDGCTGKIREPIQISNVLFMGMGSHHLCDFGFHLPKVACKGPAHLGRARIDCDSIVENCGEEFAEQQRDLLGKNPFRNKTFNLPFSKSRRLW